MIAVPVVSALIGVYQTWQTTLLGNRVMADLRGRLFEHLQRMDLAFFTATRTGAIQSRLANDVGGVQSVLSETASSILGNVVTVVAALVAMLLLSWQLTSSRSRWCRCSSCCRSGWDGCGGRSPAARRSRCRT